VVNDRESLRDLPGSSPLAAVLAFAGLAALAVVAQPAGHDWRLVFLAAAALAVGGLAAKLPAKPAIAAWLPLAPALAALAAVAFLRESHGGSASGYSPLALLAVVWVALDMQRSAMLVMVGATGLMLAVPLTLIGPPLYPANGWRGAVLLTVGAYVVGAVVNSAVTTQRMQSASARRRARELEELHEAFSAVTQLARVVSLGTDARHLVCEAVITAAGASFATVVEPRGGHVAITGSAGVPMGADDLQSVQPTASLEAYRSGRRIFIPDAARDPRVSEIIVRTTGTRSALFEPILRDGRPVGVLCVAWATPKSELDSKTAVVIALLVNEAGAAIERADLLKRLDGQAHTDSLTSLPNRRSWDETLATTVTDSDSLCIGMIDLDYFKLYNDHHGHGAGDRLLRACALAWSSHLRPADTLARYGGEEFALLLPGVALDDARRVVERMRRATPSGITASVGLVERLEREAITDVLARADEALYAAKHAGRNQLRAA
jgi:diguanylate cyclase (GGDEF)-like protein